jgi:hypothetical protein
LRAAVGELSPLQRGAFDVCSVGILLLFHRRDSIDMVLIERLGFRLRDILMMILLLPLRRGLVLDASRHFYAGPFAPGSATERTPRITTKTEVESTKLTSIGSLIRA